MANRRPGNSSPHTSLVLPGSREATEEGSIMIKLARRYGVLILLGLVLAATLYAAMSIHTEYQREKSIASEISAHAVVAYRYCGPNWVPLGFRGHLSWFNRIHSVTLFKTHTDAELRQIRSLPYLEDLTLDFPNVTEARIKLLQGFSKLKSLHLAEVAVYEHKIGPMLFREWGGPMTSQTTSEGRAQLRKALPNCAITPDP